MRQKRIHTNKPTEPSEKFFIKSFRLGNVGPILPW